MLENDLIAPGGGTTATPLNLRKRVARLQKSVSLSEKRILDCGCGPGDYLVEFLNSGYDAYGIEFDTAAVSIFQTRYPSYKNRIFQGDLENIQFPDDSFDMVFFNEVLEHVPDDAKAVSEGFRVLKHGGLIAILSPNRLYPFESHGVKLKSTSRNLPIYTPFIPYIPRSIGRRVLSYWARDYWPSDLQKLVKDHGFEILETDFVWQTFENNSTLQPKGINISRPMFRWISSTLERIPILRMFGISQFLLARKPAEAAAS